MSYEILNFFTNIVPSIEGLSSTIIVFYKNEKNLISFIIAILKAVFLMITSFHLYYLLLIKKQEMRETSVKISLILSVFNLIFALITIYIIYKQSITVQSRVDSNIKSIRNRVYRSVDYSQQTSSSNINTGKVEGKGEGKVEAGKEEGKVERKKGGRRKSRSSRNKEKKEAKII